MSINADLGHNLPLRLQQEHIFNPFQILSTPLKPAGSKHPFLLSTHLWVSAGERDCWPSPPGRLPWQHFPKNKINKSSCDSQNIFLPPLPVTFKVLLFTTRGARWTPRALLTLLVAWVARTHARTHPKREHRGNCRTLERFTFLCIMTCCPLHVRRGTASMIY